MRSRTGSEDAVAALIADDLAHLLEDDVFHEDEDGRDLVGEHVGVGRGRQPLAGHRHHVDAVRQLIEEARVGYRQLPKKKTIKIDIQMVPKGSHRPPFSFSRSAIGRQRLHLICIPSSLGWDSPSLKSWGLVGGWVGGWVAVGGIQSGGDHRRDTFPAALIG